MKTLLAGNNKVWTIMLVLLLGAEVVACSGCNSDVTILTNNLSEPLNGTTTAKVDINSSIGHLMIDRLADGEQLLASGTLQYLEKQDAPNRSINMNNGQAVLTLKAGDNKQSGFRFPWAACGGAYEWQIYLNPIVLSDITAHSNGGNIKLNLASMTIASLSADTDGGNMDVILPDNSTNLTGTFGTGGGNINIEVGTAIAGNNRITANSGAGNVVVIIPSGIAVKIHAATGAGKVIVDSQFSKTDKNTYQSVNYDSATDKIEVTVHSGAGNVSVITK